MKIIAAQRKDCEILASIISESNKDVAELFGLNFENAPKHPSFCNPDWIVSDFNRGQEYFLAIENGRPIGCVAFEHPDSETSYLNRLSVLPEFRNRGIGSSLVEYIKNYSKEKEVKTISIGIIADHAKLKEWYLDLGFIEGAIQKFEHLPFNVLYMKYMI